MLLSIKCVFYVFNQPPHYCDFRARSIKQPVCCYSKKISESLIIVSWYNFEGVRLITSYTRAALTTRKILCATVLHFKGYVSFVFKSKPFVKVVLTITQTIYR